MYYLSIYKWINISFACYNSLWLFLDNSTLKNKFSFVIPNLTINNLSRLLWPQWRSARWPQTSNSRDVIAHNPDYTTLRLGQILVNIVNYTDKTNDSNFTVTIVNYTVKTNDNVNYS